MDSLDQYPWFALHRYSLDTSSTFQLIGWKSTYFCRHAIDCWSIDISWLTLNQLSIKCWSRYLPSINWNIHHVSIEMSIKGRLTLHQHLGWESTNFCRHAIECRLMDISWLTLDQLSIKHWSRYLLGIDWVSAEYWLRCPSSVDQDLDQVDWDAEHIVQHSTKDVFSTCDPTAFNNQPTISVDHQLCTTAYLEITTWYKWVLVWWGFLESWLSTGHGSCYF